MQPHSVVEGAATMLDKVAADSLADQIAGARPALFLDYDGTLAELAPRPEQAVLSKNMRCLVHRIGRVCPVAIVSGRDLADVMALVGVSGLIYAGSHGLDIVTPSGTYQLGEEFRPAIERAKTSLEAALAHIDGALVQPKRYAITVHTRLVDPAKKQEVAEIVQMVLAGEPTLRWMGGKEMHELRPDIPWDKGTAVEHIIEVAGIGDRLPVYIGDDLTDEDAFRAMIGRGIGIIVGHHGAPTVATFRLSDVASVEDFLCRLADRMGA